MSDGAPVEYEVTLNVPVARARELVVDSMMGIGFVQRKDRKGKMFAVRTNTNFGPPSMTGERLHISFIESRQGYGPTSVHAVSEKTTLVMKNWAQPVLDHARCLAGSIDVKSAFELAGISIVGFAAYRRARTMPPRGASA